jgi:hypothetical protein
MLAGRLVTVGGGSDWAAIWLLGAGWIEPVTSEGAELCDAKGFQLELLKRVVSALQAATPAVSTPRTASRDHGRQQDWMTTARIGLLTATQHSRNGVKQAPSKDCFKQETTV